MTKNASQKQYPTAQGLTFHDVKAKVSQSNIYTFTR